MLCNNCNVLFSSRTSLIRYLTVYASTNRTEKYLDYFLKDTKQKHKKWAMVPSVHLNLDQDGKSEKYHKLNMEP